MIASHLTPEEFGAYLATGSRRHSSGQAIFFELDPAWRTDAIPTMAAIEARMPHADGSPRKSRYISIYRVLEHVPLDVIGDLHLTTPDGHVLSIASSGEAPSADNSSYHLYQEYCPVHPRAVSILKPIDFSAHITDTEQPVNVPKIVFAELTLGSLANNLDAADIGNLPYPNIDHLRDCLREVQARPDKPTKILIRNVTDNVLYRTIKDGYYLGEKGVLKYYPMPALAALESIHHAWWKSALNSFGS
ncbi:hypothetical protein AW736_21035 [Termitidicoccus mucosus]|uniref:Uncharacterized protein n=1 Tax=Termitidicoccus mucosus TaxID=1184151 RepID=A0A178IDQ2_9BACT|nr:hypothetical protein AW736_21035 [Opitutaceae bacterium TSB47]